MGTDTGESKEKPTISRRQALERIGKIGLGIGTAVVVSSCDLFTYSDYYNYSNYYNYYYYYSNYYNYYYYSDYYNYYYYYYYYYGQTK